MLDQADADADAEADAVADVYVMQPTGCFDIEISNFFFSEPFQYTYFELDFLSSTCLQ